MKGESEGGTGGEFFPLFFLPLTIDKYQQYRYTENIRNKKGKQHMKKLVMIRNIQYLQTSRPWWTDHAFINSYVSQSVPCVARVEAIRAHDYQPCMLDLTEEALMIVGEPGLRDFPAVIDGGRPKTNRSDKPMSAAQVQRSYDRLQNEGEEDIEPQDRTPWQKGDDFPE